MRLEHGEAERAEVEGGALVEDGTGCGRGDVRAVGVVGLPLGDVGEEGPDLGRGEVGGDGFVGGEVGGCAGEVAGGPDDGGLGGCVVGGGGGLHFGGVLGVVDGRVMPLLNALCLKLGEYGTCNCFAVSCRS